MTPVTAVKARNFMTDSVIKLSPMMDIMEAMRLFVTYRISGAPVIDDRGNLVGVLTERDCLKAVVQSSYHGETGAGPVGDFMSTDVSTIDAETSLMDAAAKLSDTKFRRYPVMDRNRVVGVVSRRDVLRALLDLGT